MTSIVFYSATGQGFKSPADAIVREFEAQGVAAKAVDFYAELGLGGLDYAVKGLWKFCLRHPWIFRIVYGATDSPLVGPLGFWWQLPAMRRRLDAYLADAKPDCVVSTHYISTWFLGRSRAVVSGRLPFFGYNSDVLLSHHAYIQKRAAAYFVSTELGRDRMAAQGMPPEKLRLTGFPIDPKYKRGFGSVAEERAKLGLADAFTVLFTFGGEGIGDIRLLERLVRDRAPLQAVAVCGRNDALRLKLEALAAAHPEFNLKVLGFCTNLQDYLYAADISAGKAGLNTVFEAIYLRRPFLVLMAMSNEQRCADFVVERGYGWQPRTPAAAAALIEGALAGSAEYRAALAAVAAPPCGFGIDDMIRTVKEMTMANKTERLRAAPYLLFDLAGTLCDIPIGDSWEKVNRDGILNVLAAVGFAASAGEAAAGALADAFVAEKKVLRKEAKTSLREYEIRGQLAAFFDAQAAAGPHAAFFKAVDRSDAAMARLDAAFVKPELDITLPFPEAAPLLDRFKGKKRLFLLSNNVSRVLVEGILAKCGLEDYFEKVYVSSDIGYRKPHRAFAEAVLKDLGADPADCVMIGDRLSQDIKMARDFGLLSVHVALVEHEDNLGVTGIEGDAKIETLAALADILL
jgi:processive 1,2-diacylglycerol beta-glucosyltransferase